MASGIGKRGHTPGESLHDPEHDGDTSGLCNQRTGHVREEVGRRSQLSYSGAPIFKQQETEIDTYLQVFDNLMGVHGIEEAEGSKYLGPSWTRKALETNQALSF